MAISQVGPSTEPARQCALACICTLQQSYPCLQISLLACASGAQASTEPLLQLCAVVRGMSDHFRRPGWPAFSA